MLGTINNTKTYKLMLGLGEGHHDSMHEPVMSSTPVDRTEGLVSPPWVLLTRVHTSARAPLQ